MTTNVYQRYAISNLGFLPAEITYSLPQGWESYQPIIDFIEGNNETLSGELYRKIVSETPYDEALLDTIPEMPQSEVFYLYTAFSMICQKYIWCCGPEKCVDTLPRQIGIPYYAVCKHLGLPPNLTYSSLVLWNTRLIDSQKPPTVDNIRLVLNIAPAKYMKALDGFSAVHAAIEAKGGALIDSMLKIREAITDGNSLEKIKEELRKMGIFLKDLRHILAEMYNYCDRDGFWGFRRYIGGTDNKQFFPDGLKIEGIEETFTLKGGSGTQSPLMQALDRFFSVKHNPLARQYFDEMKVYMYPPHAQFLDYLATGPQIRDYTISTKDEELIKLFDSAVGEFANYRRLHYKLIHDYIMYNIKKDEELKEQDPDKKNIFESKGTGGTDPHVFLMDVIDKTLRSKIRGSKFNDPEENKSDSTAISDRDLTPSKDTEKMSETGNHSGKIAKTLNYPVSKTMSNLQWWCSWRGGVLLLFILLLLRAIRNMVL